MEYEKYLTCIWYLAGYKEFFLNLTRTLWRGGYFITHGHIFKERNRGTKTLEKIQSSKATKWLRDYDTGPLTSKSHSLCITKDQKRNWYRRFYLLFLKINSIFNYVYMFLWVGTLVQELLETAIGSSELELQASVSCLTWVLGTELRACGRAASSFS